jgi:Spy/CpxP family protein refolding chaperone
MGALGLGFILSAGSPRPARAAGLGETSAAPATRRTPRHLGGRTIDERVAMMTKGLGLDAKQQSELKKVLEDQREQVTRLWNDPSVPAAYRVVGTQAITDKTADQIRALLNDEQRKLYNPPRPPRDAAAGSSRPSVEAWMYPGGAR